MNSEGASRKRRTQAEIQQLLAEFAASGLQASEFCRSRGLSRGTLYRYLKQGRREDGAVARSSQLLAVEVKGETRCENY